MVLQYYKIWEIRSCFFDQSEKSSISFINPNLEILSSCTEQILRFAFSAFSQAISSMIGTITGKSAAADELLVIMLCHVIIMSRHHDMAWLCVNCYMCYGLLHVMCILSLLE